ncbi:MAG: type VI secretion system tip protein VgrG [Burkholderiales bacterium]|nr:type VI secretion system tip protein VgrG [Burkholderiales bacterium]
MPVTSSVQMQLVTSPGQLMFRSMSGHEEVSRLFEYQITAVADTGDLLADDYLGKPMAVSVGGADDAPRWFNGIAASFGIEGGDGRYFSYRITLRPWLWLLTRAANVRIFQAQSTPDIVKAVIQAYQGEVVDELSGSYAPRNYCVQYRETDFNFVSRLLEEEGIFYFFRHSADKHQLVLADKATSNVPFPGFETIAFNQGDNSVVDFAGISEWQMRHEIQSGKTTLRDYNFETPATDLTAQVASHRTHAEAAHEVYDYPGLYGAAGDGSARAALRMEEAESRFGRYTGQGNSTGLVAGCKFTLDGHRRSDQNTDYVVLATQIDMKLAPYESGEGEETLFLCRFTVQQYTEPFRPARITRKPSVAGPQTAVVVGDIGEGDISTDAYARVKVQFHWDRLGTKDANSSCWVRVATPWAGNGWGMVSLPRIGQEVVVDFLEGDPDQPLITGRVYNASQVPPYELPANATVSTVKSRSKKGGATEFNELRFQDDPGNEHLFMQAQKDKFELVRNTVNTEIGKDQLLTVKGKRLEKIADEVHFNASKDMKQKVGGKLSLQVGQNMLIATDGLHSLKAAQDITAKSGTNYSIDAGTNIHVKGGVNVTIEAGVMLTLKAGGNSVVIGPSGVSITGSPLVMINSGGSASGASPVAPTAPEAPDDPEAFKDPLDGKHR